MATEGTAATLSGDGQTAWVQCKGPTAVIITNDFGGGTAKIQFKDTGGTAVDLPGGGSLTAAAAKYIDFPSYTNTEIRVDLSGSSSPDLDVLIQTALYRGYK